MLVNSSATLRAALEGAKPGQLIELAPGEYRGPFVINQPVTLRGQNRRTVLWRRAGPVLHVRAKDVKLEKVLIERTIRPAGPLVIHDVGCTPTGKESMEFDGDALINLGELIPGSPLTLPLYIETRARAAIEVTGLHGAEITPSVLEGPGKHTVTLMLQGNAVIRGEVLFGEITLREKTERGESTRYLWLSGMVLDAAPPGRSLCLAARKMFLHPSSGGVLLDGAKLNVLGLNLPVGLHAVVQRDLNGDLFMYLPGEPPSPVLVNGKPAAPRSRKLLAEGDTVQIGEATFSVQTLEMPPIEIESHEIIFADFDAKFPEAAKLGLHTLKNGWRGQVVSTVPWLSVSPEGFFRLPPARDHTWTIALNSEALTLADGLYEVANGLVVVGANHAIGIDVRLNVRRPAVSLQAAPVDCGAVESRWAEDRLIDIPIANFGRDDWSGELRANVPWLEVITPMPLSGGPWSETVAKARLATVDLAPGMHDFPDGFIVVPSEDIHAEPLPIPIRLEVRPPLGHLVIANPAVDFPDVERNMPLPRYTLQIHNEGGAPWRGKIRALHGWVKVSGEELAIEPGTDATLTVELLDIPADQALDVPHMIDEIRFEHGDNAAPVPNSIPVQLTVVERPPILSARLVSFPPYVRGDTPPESILYIHNSGPITWEGQVIANVPWLAAPDRTFSTDPGTIIGISITLTGRALDSIKAGANQWEKALTITGGRSPVEVTVQLDLRDTPTELVLETPTLNFGQLNGQLADVAAEPVRVLNAGMASWEGEIVLNVPWLSFEGSVERSFALEVPRTSVAEFKIVLNEQALTLPPGIYAEENAIQVVGQGQSMGIRALLAVNEALPWLIITPAKLAIKDDFARQITVKNEGTRRRSLQVYPAPWLRAEPLTFMLEPGQSQEITIHHNLSGKESGPLQDKRALVIAGPGREYDVAVEVTEKAIKAVRAAKKSAEQERVAREKTEQERLAQEKAEQERLEREKVEQRIAEAKRLAESTRLVAPIEPPAPSAEQPASQDRPVIPRTPGTATANDAGEKGDKH